MKIDQEIIIAYILDELEPGRRSEITELIRADDNWKQAYEKWASALNQITAEKPVLANYNDMPDRYWNSFLPRVRERIDDRAQRLNRLRERIYHAAPSFGLALVILFFLNNVLMTNKKLDYLVDQYVWMRDLNSTEIIDQYISENVAAADELISDLLAADDELGAVLADWDGSYSPTETPTDDAELSTEEQKALLENLEKTTSF